MSTTAAVSANLAAQEARTPQARVEGAMRGFAHEVGALSAFRLESCIHCGICADACHFYIATEDPQYTPIWKVEPFKQAYKREASAFAPLFKLFGLKRKVTADELEHWQHLLFDSCNMCGRCSLICPMGIDVATLIEQARHAMFEAGLAPKELYEKAAHQQQTGQPEVEQRTLSRAIARDQVANTACEIPLDKAESGRHADRAADRHRTLSRMRSRRWRGSCGIWVSSCTFRSDGLVAENYGYYAGGKDWQRHISLRLIDQAMACKAKVLIVPECGHAYTALRWEAADLYGKPLPFKVRHVTEYPGRAAAARQIAVASRRNRRNRPSMIHVSWCARAASLRRHAH